MKTLKGWDNSLKNEATRIAGELNSRRPYAQFSIIGERRSGRSTFFQCLAAHINMTANYSSDLIGLAGDLEITEAGSLVTAFHEALVRSVGTSGGDRVVNCELSEQELLQTDALFLLASRVIENLKRTPVFLIDMGVALESADNASILKLARVLKWVANNSNDRDIPFALGLGLTTTFFEHAKVIAGDVFRDRYQPRRALGNSFESEAPFETFKGIVKDIAGAEIPTQFTGLLRVPGLTVGMYGENLRALKVKGEVSPKLIWEALRAYWKIIPQLSYADTGNFSPADLAELLLADGRLPDNRGQQYLEKTAPNSYGANDKLYERFGLLPPRRDPTIRERFRNRLNDPEDSALVDEIARSMGQALEGVCQAEILETTIFPGRSAIVTATLKQLPPTLGDESQGTPDLDQNFDAKALPKRLTIGIYLDSPDSQEFEKELSTGLKRGDFLMVCYPQGVLQPIAATELIRSAKQDGFLYSKVEATEDELCTLVSRSSDTAACDTMVVSWTNRCLSEHLDKRLAIPLLYETAKKAIGAIIASAGRLKAEDLKTNLDLSNAECGELIARLQDAGIITKKKGVVYWDPAQDPLLGSLLSTANAPEKLSAHLREKFTLSDSPLNPQEVLVSYSGVFQGKKFDSVSENDVVSWYEAHRPQLLQIAESVINSDNELAALKETAQSLSNKKVENWQDISGDRLEIDTLFADAREKLEDIKRSRENAAKELQQAKDSLKKFIQDHSSYFTESEREEMLSQIDEFTTATSVGMTQLRKTLEKRINELDATRKALDATKERLQELKAEAGEQIAPMSNLIHQADELLTRIDTSKLTPQLVELNKKVDEAERKILRTKVVAISRPAADRTQDTANLKPPPDTRLIPPLPEAPKRGNRKHETAVKPLPPVPLAVSTEVKEEIFDLSEPEQAKKLVALLQSPKAEIKRIQAAFQ